MRGWRKGRGYGGVWGWWGGVKVWVEWKWGDGRKVGDEKGGRGKQVDGKGVREEENEETGGQ